MQGISYLLECVLDQDTYKPASRETLRAFLVLNQGENPMLDLFNGQPLVGLFEGFDVKATSNNSFALFDSDCGDEYLIIFTSLRKQGAAPSVVVFTNGVS